MKLFLAIAAILAWLFGAILIAIPEPFYQPTGIAMTPLLATIAHLVVQIFSLGVVLRTMTLGPGMAVAPGIVIHIVLGGFFAFFLLRARKA